MATAPLAGFSQYQTLPNGGLNDPGAQAFLAALQKYDPGAHYQATQTGQGDASGYTLLYDPSKLPGVNVPGASYGNGSPTLGPSQGQYADTLAGQWGPSWQDVGAHTLLKNPGAVTNSSIYGNITANSNIKHPFDPMDILGPLAVAGSVFAFPALFGQGGLLTGGASAAGGATAAGGPTDANLGNFGATAGGADGTLGTTTGGAAGAAAGAAPIVDESTQAPLWESIAARLGIPVSGNALSTFGPALGALGKGTGLLTGGSPTGNTAAGGGSLISIGGGNKQIPDSASLLRQFYAPKIGDQKQQANGALSPNDPMALMQLRMMGLIG